MSEFYVRLQEPERRFEARQFDGTRNSIAELLQDRDEVPTGMQVGEWLTRAVRSVHVRVYRDHTFNQQFTRFKTCPFPAQPVRL